MNGLYKEATVRADIGIYIHVPFCAHICPYCDFRKTAKFNRQQVEAYFSALLNQAKQLVPLIPAEYQKATLYLGGGTPSLFKADKYKDLIEYLSSRFSFLEMSLETNPLRSGEKVLRQMQEFYDLGFRRVTIGAQSLCPDTLKFLGRHHTSAMILESCHMMREQLAFEQVQVDLIYGLTSYPRQIKIEEQIRSLVSAGATGISCYALSIEERTKFSSLKDIILDEKMGEEYDIIYQTCLSLGMEQLETSNFSLRPLQSLHNNIYWKGLPYLGLGTGAHGLLPPKLPQEPYGRRYSVGPLPEKILSHEGEAANDVLSFLSPEELADMFALHFEPEARTKVQYQEEMIFLLLRTPEGISASLCREFWGETWMEKIINHPQLKKCHHEALMFIDSDKGLQIAGPEKIRADFINQYLLSFF